MMLRIEYRKKNCSCYAIIKVCGFRVNRHLVYLCKLTGKLYCEVVKWLGWGGGGGRTRSFLLSQQFSTHTLCMVFLARLFLGLCLLLFADTVAEMWPKT